MATLERYLDRLKKLRVEFAVSAMENPGPLTEGNFGYLKGQADGLKRAEKLIDEVLTEVEKKEL